MALNYSWSWQYHNSLFFVTCYSSFISSQQVLAMNLSFELDNHSSHIYQKMHHIYTLLAAWLPNFSLTHRQTILLSNCLIIPATNSGYIVSLLSNSCSTQLLLQANNDSFWTTFASFILSSIFATYLTAHTEYYHCANLWYYTVNTSMNNVP